MTQAHAAKFTTGSMMRHVVVMTATGSIGLMAVFVVDLLNLFYISLLGEQELAAAIGYAGTVLFFATSICIGVTISGVALVSQALGARERDRARRLAASSLVFMIVVSTVLTLATLPFVGSILSSLGAEGHTHAIAWRFLLMVLPSTPLLGIGMSCAGLLRSAGDARRAMYVTLVGGLVTAALDPLLIFAFGLGVDGAAIASVFSRVALTAVGLYGAVKVHDLVARPSAASPFRRCWPMWRRRPAMPSSRRRWQPSAIPPWPALRWCGASCRSRSAPSSPCPARSGRFWDRISARGDSTGCGAPWATA
jgi:Na+-driven multidrug efflux pump